LHGSIYGIINIFKTFTLETKIFYQMNTIFFELTLILLVAGVISYIISFLKQPTIIAYIVTGLIVGPLGFYRLQNGHTFEGLASIGITLLLFMVGLELDMGQLKKIGKTALYVGILQVVITTALGFIILRALNINMLAALFVAPALTFSSTIVVIKLLSEKKDLQSLYGKLVIGIFLTQDFFAILILICLSSFNSGQSSFYGNLPIWQNILMALIRLLILLLVIFLLSKKVFPKILKTMERNDELQLICALAWALGLSAFVSLPFMGFSLEIGGFLAGLSLASSGLHYELSSRVKSIRDFFIIIFFIVLGSGLAIPHLGSIALPAVVLSLFVVIGNPLIVMVILGFFGYKPRTGFLAGVTVAQISEFSIILVALGSRMGHVTPEIVGLVTLIGIISISLSSYIISHGQVLYEKLKPLLKVFDFKKGSAERHASIVALKNHIVLVGAHRLGHHLVDSLKKQGAPFIIVDFNPEVVEKYIEEGVVAICGDIADTYIQEQANLESAKLIVSTIPDFNDNLILLSAVRKASVGRRIKPKLIFIAQDEAEIKRLYQENIDYVISPHFMGGVHLAKILESKNISAGLKKLREHHIRILES